MHALLAWNGGFFWGLPYLQAAATAMNALLLPPLGVGVLFGGGARGGGTEKVVGDEISCSRDHDVPAIISVDADNHRDSAAKPPFARVPLAV